MVKIANAKAHKVRHSNQNKSNGMIAPRQSNNCMPFTSCCVRDNMKMLDWYWAMIDGTCNKRENTKNGRPLAVGMNDKHRVCIFLPTNSVLAEARIFHEVTINPKFSKAHHTRINQNWRIQNDFKKYVIFETGYRVLVMTNARTIVLVDVVRINEARQPFWSRST